MRLWFKNKKSKNKIAQEEKQFIPLYPNDNDVDSIYVKRLKEVYKDSKIHNIGVTGPYGSGKSSVIQSFLKGLRSQDAFVISLANFKKDEKNNDNLDEMQTTGLDKNNDNVFDSKDIEIGILQQIIYCIDSKKIPLSTIVRIKEEKEYALRFVIALCICVGNYNWLKSTLVNIFPEINNVGVVLTFLGIICGVIWGLGILMKKFNVTSINFNGLDFSKENKNDSILNEYIDEIIYILKCSKCKFIVFEDIDRFNNKEIFYKLRELNKIINDNYKIKKRGGIKFIYAIRDDLLIDAEDRIKFFDYILPIIPIISYNNSQLKFLEILKIIGLENVVSNKIIQEISYFVKDMRLAINICNEFKIYYERIFKELSLSNNYDYSIDKLFSIVAYKNVEIYDFQKMQYKEGQINKLIEYKKYLSAYKKEAIIELENKKDNAQKELEEVQKQIRKEIIEGYEKNFGSLINSKIQTKQEEYFSTDDFIERGNLNDVFENGLKGNNHSVYRTINNLKNNNDWKNKNSKANVDYNNTVKPLIWEMNIMLKKDYENLFIRDIYLDDKAFLNLENFYIKEKDKMLENTKEEKVRKKIIEEYDKELEILKIIKTNKMLLSLVRNGYLTEDYEYYLNNIYLDDMTLEEHDYIANIKNLKKVCNYDIRIKNFELVYSKFDDKDFYNKYILNIDLLNQMLIMSKTKHFQDAQDLDKRIDLMEEHIVEEFVYPDKTVFLWNYYIANHEYKKNFSKRLMRDKPNILKVIADTECLNIDEIEYLIKTILGDVNLNEINNDECLDGIVEIINKFKNIDLYLLKNISENIINPLQIINITNYTKESKAFIIENSLYEINKDNINSIFEYYGIVQPKDNIIFSLLEINNPSINENVAENIDKFILLEDFSKLSDDTLIVLLNFNDERINYDNLIEKYQGEIDNLSLINNEELREKIILSNKVRLRIEDINEYISTDIKEDVVRNIDDKIEYYEECFKKYIPKVSRNINRRMLSTGSLINKNELMKLKSRRELNEIIEKILKVLVNSSNISNDNLIKLLSIYNKKIVNISLIDDVEKDRLVFLINNNFVIFDEKTFEFVKENCLECLNTFCVNNISKFIELMDDFDLDESDDKDILLIKNIVMSKNISNSNKCWILNRFGYTTIYPDAEEDIITLLEILLMPECEYKESFDFNWLKNLFSRTTNDSIRIKIIEAYEDKMDDDQIINLISILNNNYYKNIIPGGGKVDFDKNDEIILLVEKIKERKILNFYKRKDTDKYYFNR